MRKLRKLEISKVTAEIINSKSGFTFFTLLHDPLIKTPTEKFKQQV